MGGDVGSREGDEHDGFRDDAEHDGLRVDAGPGARDTVTLGADVLRRYAAFSRFNSPYPAHDDGRAIDLYPTDGAPSPVAGEVVETLTTRAPDRPYAEANDHLIVVDTGDHLARLLHVEPSVEPGDVLAVGDPLGRTIRSGYFAPWVDDHVHLGFRPRDADPVRASGSLPVAVDVEVEPVPWDGRGTVVERGDTYVVLDAPGHPAPGERFAGVAADGWGRGALDGGLPHYAGGGLVGGDRRGDGRVSLAGHRVGRVAGGLVTWDDVAVFANGVRVYGLSFACHRDRLGAKLVAWDGVPAEVGESVAVAVRRPEEGAGEGRSAGHR